MSFTPTQFEKLAINDLEYNKFVLDSNGNVAVRVSSVGGGGSVSLQNFVFVAKNGNDTTGLRNRLDKPFLTIAAGAAVLQPGDTLWVMPGQYLPTATITITNCNIYLQDAIIDYGNTHVGPLFSLIATSSFGQERKMSLYGTGSIYGSPPSGVALISTSSNGIQTASWYIFLREVGPTRLLSASINCPIFSVTGTLNAEIYQSTRWLGSQLNGLFQFATTSTSNRFYYKCPSMWMGLGSWVSSNFKGVAEIQIDNYVCEGSAFDIQSGATGTLIVKNTGMYVSAENAAYGIVVESGASPTVISWNNVTYLEDNGNGKAVAGNDPNTPIYFYGVNQSNHGILNVLEKVGTLTTDTNLIFPNFVA